MRSHFIITRWTSLAALLAISCFTVAHARGDVLDGVGVVGDGGAAGISTDKYPGMLYSLRGIDFGGPLFTYDHAHSGANSGSIIQPGDQIDQVIAQVQSGDVTLALISIGENDMFPHVASVASGALSGSALAAQQATLVNNIETAVDRVLAAGGKVVLGGLSDVADSPTAGPYVSTPEGKARVENAIHDMQVQLAEFALARDVPFIDFYGLEKAVFDSGSFVIGGVDISLTTYGPDPHNFFQDSLNAGIAIRGEIANLWLQAINEGFGTSVPLLTDEEILTLAGIGDEYVDETFQAAVPLATFVQANVPEPSSIVLFGLGCVGLVYAAARRRKSRTLRPAAPERVDYGGQLHGGGASTAGM